MKNLRICFAIGLLFVLYGSSHHSQSPGPVSLFFEENRGQGPANVRFLARGPGYNIALTPEGNEAVLRRSGRQVSVRSRLVYANSKTVIRGERQQAGKVHYLRSGLSLTDIPTFASVRYEGVYPGIDLVYYGNQHQLEYDFVVSPGADPGGIALGFDGIDALTVDAQGNLVLHAGDSEIIQQKPVVYQRVRNSRQEIEGAYRLSAQNTVAFEIGPYDHEAALVIDPILSYATFLGGSDGDDHARAAATDSSGNLYITGSTTSTNFRTAAPFQPNAGSQDPTAGISDAFVTKLNPAGTALIFSTYFGGGGDDDATAIAVDAQGNVVIAGTTASTDLPTTAGAFRRTCNTGPGGCLDAFVATFRSTGASLVYSTYLGGTGDDEARGVAVDPSGNAYVTGRTDSPNFMTTTGAYSTDAAGGGFVTKLSSTGSVVYSTYLGSLLNPADPRGIAVDSSGNAYVTGGLSAGGGTDVFVTKLNATGTAAIYTQTIRGAKNEIGNAIAVDSAGNAYVAGETESIDFPATAGAVQTTFGGGPAFRSTDGGSAWTARSRGITRTSLYALAVEPGSTSTIYVGADDETSGGLFKSTDRGDSWSSAGSGIVDARIHALAVDPATPSTVYAGSRTLGVFKSANGGATWSSTPLNSVFVTALAIDPSAPATIYAGTDANGIYKSTNGGTSWSAINAGLVNSTVRSVVVDPNASTTVYAATSSGVYKSTNGGSSWVAASGGLLDPNVNALVIDPRSPNLIFAGTNSQGVVRSVSGGTFWIPSNGGLTSASAGILVSTLTLDPVSGTFYAAFGESNAMRVYKSSNGTTWTATNLATARLTALALDRSNANVVYAATVGGSDAFVAKWNSSGALVYATYLGGYRDDAAGAIAVDSSGNAYVTGRTSSTNFPIVYPLQPAFGGGSGAVTDAFAAKLSASGAELVYSTYFGGSSDDFGKGIAVDSHNTAFVVGITASADFPTSSALTATRPGLLDAFVVKIGESSTIPYTVPVRGGFSVASQDGGTAITAGHARIQQTGSGAMPSGLAIFSLRQDNILVSEAAVPATSTMTAGRIYAEFGGVLDIGIAMANPNPAPATVTFYFTDSNGQNLGQSSTTIAANGQIAAFLDQPPFNGSGSLLGSFTFSSSQPVAVVALRGLTNERGNFVITTLPVADLSLPPETQEIFFPYFADGDGWMTQILLVNTTDAAVAGTVQLSGLASQDYSIAARSAVKVSTPGLSDHLLRGTARVSPKPGSNTPSGVAVFSLLSAAVTVTAAGVAPVRPASAFRLYAESSGASGQTGSIETGIAVANPSSNPAVVSFELTTITGRSTGLNGSIVVAGDGIESMFLGQIPGFANLPNPFQGVLRVSTPGSTGISVVGLRGRYNERQDFLITTTQPTNESSSIVAAEQFFPYFADGNGYTTQFILFNGSVDQSSAGVIRFFGKNGQTLSIGLR